MRRRAGADIFKEKLYVQSKVVGNCQGGHLPEPILSQMIEILVRLSRHFGWKIVWNVLG